NLLRIGQAPPIETLLPLLLNDLVHLPEGSILVLDDYHVIDAPAVHQALQFLLDHLPPQLHLVIASRADPPLALSRLRARGQLTELRAHDLRFTLEEAAMFLREVMGLVLGVEEVAALEARTEGWIAGLQLAALSMQDRSGEQMATFIEAFTGSHRFVVDYLVDEVLARQPPHLQTFLLQTSILERLCGPLCGAVVLGDEAEPPHHAARTTQQAYSQALLEELEHNNLFIVPLDDERHWYRYHHLFAQVLRERLVSGTKEDTVASLHRRAGTWFEAQGLVEEAVQHALAAQDWERAAGLIEGHGLLLMLKGHLQQVTDWLDALPDTRVRERPVLSIIRAVSFMFSNRLASVEAYLQHAERWIQPDTPDDQARTIRGAAAGVRANVSYLVGDLPRVIASVHEALEVLPETEVSELPGMLVTIFRSATKSFTGLTYKVTGDVTSASERLAADVIAPVRAAGNLFATLYSMTYLALLQVYQGRLRVAADTYAQAAQLAPEAGGLQILVASPIYYIGRGDLLRERNELDAAAQYLRQGIDLVRGTMTIDANAATHGYIAWARLQQARGDSLGARATLEEFVHLAEQRDFFHVLVARGAAAQAQLVLAQGDLAAARRWAETSGLGVDDELAFFRESEYLALARVYIAQGRHSSVRHILCDAVALLDRLLQAAETGERNGSVIEILILRALALQAQGDLSHALDVLERALTLAAPEDYVRVFVDEGAPMAVLLARGLDVRNWGREPGRPGQDVRSYASRLLAVFEAEG
ncbi:MAG TPA: hypothetical protein VEZ12_07915, partial [Herpetosiphonaceae bacterium]|nr:hypothetical protein [Herpetosiphonaceae bacterium]